MATQVMTMLGEHGFKISTHMVEKARKTPWTFHGSRYCQLICNTNKEKKVQWAKDNLHSSFDDVVWTSEFTIYSAGEQLDIFIEGWLCTKAKTLGTY